MRAVIAFERERAEGEEQVYISIENATVAR